MRAREFILEKGPSLADQLRQAVVAQKGQQMGQKPPSDTNQMKTGVSSQGTAGSVPASQASAQQQPSGGTQTPQDGTKPMGALGGFISGLTGGKASSLSGLAGVGAATAMQGAGLNKTVDATASVLDKDMSNLSPQQLSTILKPGQQLTHPELGKIKINKVSPQGLEIDTSQSPQLGVKKMNIDLKTLAQKR